MTGLFDNEREANLASTVALIEEVLVALHYRLDEARTEMPACRRAWRIPKGSALVEIGLIERPDGLHMRVTATVLRIDDNVDREALFERLLSLNGSQLIGDAFALRGDQVILVGQRSTRDLDSSEIRELVESVLYDADHFDDKLLDEFGGKRT